MRTAKATIVDWQSGNLKERVSAAPLDVAVTFLTFQNSRHEDS